MPTNTAAQTFQASEAKTHFLRILDDVERGDTVFITRHGKRIARIQPEAEIRVETVQQAFEQMRELRKRTGRMSLKEILTARDEGRR